MPNCELSGSLVLLNKRVLYPNFPRNCFSGDFIMLRCSDKSYSVQGLSKSYMCEHISSSKGVSWFMNVPLLNVFLVPRCTKAVQNARCTYSRTILVPSYLLQFVISQPLPRSRNRTRPFQQQWDRWRHNLTAVHTVTNSTHQMQSCCNISGKNTKIRAKK